jgi:hypothetical protein
MAILLSALLTLRTANSNKKTSHPYKIIAANCLSAFGLMDFSPVLLVGLVKTKRLAAFAASR